MAKDSIHTKAVGMAVNDMHKVIDSFGPDLFMSNAPSDKTAARRKLFEAMAPDLQKMLAEGMPMSVVERLARADKES